MQKQKTYSEERNKPIIDWNKVISDLRSEKIKRRDVKGDITDEFKEIERRAVDWVTCACGNQCSVIPRCSVGRPIDSILAQLGGYFPITIANGHEDNYERAEKILKDIEYRSAKILKEMVKNNLDHAEA